MIENIEFALKTRISSTPQKEAKQTTLDQLSVGHIAKRSGKIPLGIEFFDHLFANPSDPISYYVDTDILFLRPFSGLFDT